MPPLRQTPGTDPLVSIHVVAALIGLGLLTVAVSLFSGYTRASLGDATISDAERVKSEGLLRLLHRITIAYTATGVTVPDAGIGAAANQPLFGQTWIEMSIGVVTVAGPILALGGINNACQRPAPQPAKQAA